MGHRSSRCPGGSPSRDAEVTTHRANAEKRWQAAAVQRGWSLLLLLLVVAGIPAAFAQMPLARLTTVFPPGGQRGTTQEVVLQGSDLDDLTGLWSSNARVTAVPKPGRPLAWDLVIPEDVPPGRIDLRAAGRFGLSNPRAFVIGRAPELTLNPTNVSVAAAWELAPDVVVNGRVPAGVALWFRVSLTAGQRVVFRVAGRELDSRLEPVLTVLDAARAEVDTTRRRWLAFETPVAGSWWVRLHDVTYRGGDEYPFRLVASTAPEVEWAWPQSVQRGLTNRVLLMGRQLPGGTPTRWRGPDGRPLESVEVDIFAPADLTPAQRPCGWRLASAAVDGWWWTPPSEWRVTAPLCFALAAGTNLVAAPTEAPTVLDVTLPCEVWGQAAPRGAWSGVRFRASKGEVWWLEVQSERLGFGTDTLMVVQRETGAEGATRSWVDVVEFQDQDANFGTPGYNTQTRDPAGRFEAPEEGAYRVVVRDSFRLAPDQPRLPYRLLVRAEAPGFALVAHPVMPPSPDPNLRPSQPWVTMLRRGESQAVRVLAFRRDGFAGDIELAVEGLPPGVVASPTRIYSGQNAATFVLQAAEDVGAWSGTVRVVGHAQSGDRQLNAAAASASVLWNVGDYNNELATARWADGFALSVSGGEAAPVVVEPVEAKPAEAVENARVSIPLRVVRRGEFTADLKLKAVGHPELEKLAELTVAGSSTQAVLEIPLAERKLPPGTHTFFLQALTPGKYRNQPEAVAAAEAELKAAEQTLASATGDEKPRAEAAKKAAEERKKAAEERAKPRDVQVAVHSKAITLHVQPAPKP